MAADSADHFKTGFFIERVVFSGGTLRVLVGPSGDARHELVFDHVRSFLFFKESDFFDRLAKRQALKLIDGGPAGQDGVFRITQGAILGDVMPNALKEEQPSHYWVTTADECLEVVGFSDPHVASAQ